MKKDELPMKQFLYRILCGFFLGLSIVAPGLSGALVAIAMGVYHEIVRIIANPLKKLKQNLMFCIPLGIGAVVSAILFVIIFDQLFESYEKAILLLFVGLIAGSIPLVYFEVKKLGFKPFYLIGAIFACIIAIAMGVFASETGLMSGAAATLSDWFGLAIGGFAAGVTALVPGMSLATVLALLGVYSPLISAARELLRMELTYILPIGLFVVFAVVGLMSTAKGVKFVFNKFPGFSNTTVLGFQFGSLVSIMYKSHQIQDPNFNWLSGAIMLAVGLGISVLFIVSGRLMNKTETEEI
jgi:putative membrane protein